MAFQGGLKMFVVAFVLFALVMCFSPGLLEFNPVTVKIKPCPRFEGSLALNNKLDGLEKLLENQISGPESIAFYKGDMYTGLLDGRIVRIRGKKIETVTQFGDPKAPQEVWGEDLRGRPLGLRFDDTGTLYATDAYYGLFKIDVETGAVTTLYSTSDLVAGKKAMIVNDIDISKSGLIYFSDSSQYPLNRAVLSYLEAVQTGRILRYDPRTNQTEVVVDGFAFANGVQLSPDEDFLLICESLYFKILKFYLKGPNKGKLEVFMDSMPGMPDNIRPTPRGTYWVGQCGCRTNASTVFLEKTGDKPLFRKFCARSLDVIQSLVGFFISYIHPFVFLQEFHHKMTHLSTWANVATPAYGLIIEVDQKGNIINSLHSLEGHVRCVSEVAEHDNSLYLGSPWHSFVGKVKAPTK